MWSNERFSSISTTMLLMADNWPSMIDYLTLCCKV
jgi:hypothetical protein